MSQDPRSDEYSTQPVDPLSSGSAPVGSTASDDSAGPAGLNYASLTAPAGAYAGPPPTEDEKLMGMLAHLLAIFTGFLGPLIIWLVKKDSSPFVDDQGKQSLNFQLTMLIGYIVGYLLTLFIAFLFIFVVYAFGIVSLIFVIIASIKAKSGEAYRYPFAIRFIS